MAEAYKDPIRSRHATAMDYGTFGLPHRRPSLYEPAARQAVVQGRIALASTTRLYYERYSGKWVEANGEMVELATDDDLAKQSGPGLQFSLNTTDSLIDASGGLTGSGMGASTLYYLYVGNSQVSGIGRLRASSTQYTERDEDGVRYLGTYGTARNWRFVGWVRTDGSTQFLDNATDRRVANYYNRRLKNIRLRPGYSDDNAVTSYTTTSTSWTAANGGTGATGSYIANGEDAIHATAIYVADLSGNVWRGGIGDNSTTTASSSCQGGGNSQAAACSFTAIQTEGYYTISVLIKVDGGTGTYYADVGRMGGASDAPGTLLDCMVMM